MALGWTRRGERQSGAVTAVKRAHRGLIVDALLYDDAGVRCRSGPTPDRGPRRYCALTALESARAPFPRLPAPNECKPLGFPHAAVALPSAASVAVKKRRDARLPL